jgi:hypothetical protein
VARADLTAQMCRVIGAVAVALGACAKSSPPETPAVADAATDAAAALPACPDDPLAPQDTFSPPRPTLPWRLDRTTADGGAVAALPASCQSTGPGSGRLTSTLHCRGSALVVGDGTGANLQLVFDAATSLRWNRTPSVPAVAPPAVVAGDTVFVDYQIWSFVICPFCGGYDSVSVEVRDREGGRRLWWGFESPLEGDLDDATVRAIFGVPARRRAICRERYRASCYDIVRDKYDHVLATSPETTIEHATVTTVTTPQGKAQVLWAASAGDAERVPNCADGGDPAADNGFAISWLPAGSP